MYFKDFPNIYYTYNINGKDVLKVVRDITTNVRLRKDILSNITLYDSYDIQEGDTPEIVAAKYYGSSEYHWAIMLANEIYDYREDWPMSQLVLNEYIKTKYNQFDAISWTYSGDVVTAVIPDHGITLDGTDDVVVNNAYVTITDIITGEQTIELANGLDGTLNITGVLEDSITFTSNGQIEGTPTGGVSIYTSAREYRTKHYELDGYIVSADEIGAQPVTYYDYEVSLNDSKRNIKLISPGIVAQIADELKKLIG
jgi:hypothetical protein